MWLTRLEMFVPVRLVVPLACGQSSVCSPYECVRGRVALRLVRTVVDTNPSCPDVSGEQTNALRRVVTGFRLSAETADSR